MEDWEAYKGITEANAVVMDQITQNAVLLSARIGIEVAPGSLNGLQSWDAANTVSSQLCPRHFKGACKLGCKSCTT